MEEIRDIKKEGQCVNKSLVGGDMEAVDVGIGQPGPGGGGGGRREENVLFESSSCSGGLSDEAHGGHDWFKLLVRHNRLEGSRVPQGQFPHTALLHHLSRDPQVSECRDYGYN